jgi:hypothetical protein
MNDDDEDVQNVIGNELVFMADYSGLDDDEIEKGEEVLVDASALSLNTSKDDSCNHDTGAMRHIFHDQKLFHNYEKLDTPLTVKGFGSNLSTIALGKGTILLRSIHNGVTRTFSLSNVLHILTARCNLISGSQLDRKGVSTHTGSGRITYFNANGIPFASGSIVSNLYWMDVRPVQATEATATDTRHAPDADVIAAMVPDVTSLFRPGTETEAMRRVGFTTI